jgi:hypothetical protein
MTQTDWLRTAAGQVLDKKQLLDDMRDHAPEEIVTRAEHLLLKCQHLLERAVLQYLSTL